MNLALNRAPETLVPAGNEVNVESGNSPGQPSPISPHEAEKGDNGNKGNNGVNGDDDDTDATYAAEDADDFTYNDNIDTNAIYWLLLVIAIFAVMLVTGLALLIFGKRRG